MKNLISTALVAYVMVGSLPIQYVHAKEQTQAKVVTVFKTAWCGCCQTWVEALEKAGYRVETNDLDDLSAIKKQAGIPKNLESCHTAVLGDGWNYILEGHVPLEAIEKLVVSKPNIRGISVPGMPNGSLGMGYDPTAKYSVFAFQSADLEPTMFYEAGKK